MEQLALSGLLIFALRIVDITLYTLRIMMVVRGRKALAWIFGLFQALVFVVAIRSVLNGLDNPWNIVGYATGFATGLVVGMSLEARLAIGYTQLRIISTGRGAEICERLRQHGYAVTEVAGRGLEGTVNILSCSVLRKDTDKVTRLVDEYDPNSFITAEAVLFVKQGFWHS